MARNVGMTTLQRIVEEFERYEVADDLLHEIWTDTNNEVELPTRLRIKLDKYVGYDDSE